MGPRLVVLLALAVLLWIGVVGIAAAQDEEPAPSSTADVPESPGIIPEPDSGTAPTDAGDRGGALQVVVLVAILGGVGVIGLLVVRESRKARADRGL